MTEDVAVLEAVAASLASIAAEEMAERRRLLAERDSLVAVLRGAAAPPAPAGRPVWAAGGGQPGVRGPSGDAAHCMRAAGKPGTPLARHPR
ncbi:hypothetical protein I4F81_011735 [Pyropia yezoensis]|uniref:Uncharacterized protein n=1 Tax=Pyropia yezoensis TaxID=2788 RepID=A0ACC3CHJ8_PYRYE|nr:hypothetical protein I4F81_011735 [Neopyropia yezoensis]